MSVTHSRAREIIKEVVSKRLLKETGNEQEGPDKPLSDVLAIQKMINARLEGKMEWRQGALLFLEFIMEFMEEGAQASDLQIICKELMGDAEGNRLYNILKIMAQAYREKRPEGGFSSADDGAKAKIAKLSDEELEYSKSGGL